METTLNYLREGQCARIKTLRMQGAMRRRLLDFGLIELRRQDSRCIAVETEP